MDPTAVSPAAAPAAAAPAPAAPLAQPAPHPPSTVEAASSADAPTTPGRGDGRKGHTPRGGHGGRRPQHQLVPATPNPCVVLKNLDYQITQSDLEEVVRRVAGGRKGFVNLSLIDDKVTGSFRGMAFVNFHSVEDATSALAALSKMNINNRKVVAEFRRMRPGDRERREQHERRIRSKFDHAPSRNTFESDVVAAVDADGNQLDKRRAFFQKRDDVRKLEESKRLSEKEIRERERTAEFRARLEEYRDAPVEEGKEIEDLVFASNLTSYERRVVHVLCDELGLGHISQLNEDGFRVLSATKHPVRMEEWNVATAEIRAAANERKGPDPEDKKKKKEARKEAQRLAAAEKAAASATAPDGRASPEWKKSAEPTTVTPVTKEELEGIKWFKPRAAKAADGEEGNASNTIRVPTFKLYIPPRQPTGPDGTIGFHSRKPPAPEGGDGDAEGDGTEAESPTSAQDAAVGSEDTAAKQPGLKSSGSQGMLNPTVPAFTPSAAYASSS